MNVIKQMAAAAGAGRLIVLGPLDGPRSRPVNILYVIVYVVELAIFNFSKDRVARPRPTSTGGSIDKIRVLSGRKLKMRNNGGENKKSSFWQTKQKRREQPHSPPL